MRVLAALAMLVVVGLLGGATASVDAAGDARRGGEFRIALVAAELDYIDPALAYRSGSWALLDTTCARLMSYPDRPPFRLRPEVALRYPRVTNKNRTFTFTIRPGLKFSDGTKLQASAFARAINRTLAPEVTWSEATGYTRDIVGADEVQAGKRPRAAGVVVRGNKLIVTLTRPAPDFPLRTTMPFFCAVPPNLPVDAEGTSAPLHAAGPYYISQYVRGRQVVLRRNRFYRGNRPQHVDTFRVDLTSSNATEVINRIENGRADWGIVPPGAFFEAGLPAKYGTRGPRFFVDPGLGVRQFVFNSSGGVFRKNPQLRRAVNFAVDRTEIRRVALGGPVVSTLTDQYLPPGLPGFKNARIYPFRPKVARARRLANGHTGNGRVVLLTFSFPPAIAVAQVIRRNLAAIGLDVEIDTLSPQALGRRLITPGARWDLGFRPWAGDFLDPYAYLNGLLDSRFAGPGEAAYFDSRKYNRLLRQAAGLQGAKRIRAYGRLDVQLARDVAPMLALDYLKEGTFVSRRVDPRCVVRRPWLPGWSLNLAVVCLKR